MAVKGTMNAPRRRIVFGLNVIVQAILAIVLLGAVVWGAGRLKLQADLTGAGRNSLSPRTIQLLRDLPEDVRITAVFAEPDKRDVLGQKRRRTIRDLLDLYDARGGARVSTYLLDPSLQKPESDKLLQRLQELPAYRDESQPHKEALATFEVLNERIRTLASQDFGRLEELVEGNQALEDERNLSIVRLRFRQLERDAQSILEQIQELSRSEIPRYGQAVREVRDYLSTTELLLQNVLGWMTGDAQSIPGITPDVQTFFTDAPGRYEEILTEIRGVLEKTSDLSDVKLEELYRELTRWRLGNPPVLVETQSEARVLPFHELWPEPRDRNAPVGPDGDTRQFAGEATISSAILQLTQKAKTAVVFVRFGGEPLLQPDFSQMQMTRRMPDPAPYQQLNEMLEKSNFLTAEWDVAASVTPPTVEEASRILYVVLPPPPPQQPNPMQPTPPARMTDQQRQAVLDAVDVAGEAMFLTGWIPPTSPMPGAVSTYEYADYLRTNWNIDVQYNYVVLSLAPHPEKPGWWVPASNQPLFINTDDVVRLTDHPIAEPSKADRAGFTAVAPLEILKGTSKPAGLEIEVIAEVPRSDDIWACHDIFAAQEQLRRDAAMQPADDDLRSPFPIAVGASRDQGQKLVVFSSAQFAADAIAQAPGLLRRGNAWELGLVYAANTDLFINALHWLTGEADRIAVGPKGGSFPRLRDLKPETAETLPWLLVLVWPATALIVGFGVWLVRRR